MRYLNLMNVNLNQIICFQAIVKYKNMTVAANSLNLTQPLLSQRITCLESELGIKLFERVRNKLELTQAGSFLYEKWSTVIQNMEEAIDEAYVLTKKYVPEISIGCYDGLNREVIFKIAKKISKIFPNIKIQMKVLGTFFLRDELLGGGVDLAIMPNYEQVERTKVLIYNDIKELPLMIYANKRNIADVKKIGNTIQDIKISDNTEILCQRQSTTGSYEKYILEVCSKYNITPNIKYCDNLITAIVNATIGNGIVMAVKGVNDINDQEFTAFELQETAVQIVVGYRNEENTLLAEILKKAINIIKKEFEFI